MYSVIYIIVFLRHFFTHFQNYNSFYRVGRGLQKCDDKEHKASGGASASAATSSAATAASSPASAATTGRVPSYARISQTKQFS